MESKQRSRIVTSLAWSFLPVALLPFVAFGWLALDTHHRSLERAAFDFQQMMGEALAAPLEASVLQMQTHLANLLVPSAASDEAAWQQIIDQWRQSNPDIAEVVWLDPQGRVRRSAPRAPENYGRPWIKGWLPTEGSDAVHFDHIALGSYGNVVQYAVTRRLRAEDGTSLGYLAAKIALSTWLSHAHSILQGREEPLAAIVPLNPSRNNANIPIRLTYTGADFWVKLHKINTSPWKAAQLEFDGEPYTFTKHDIAALQLRLVLAQPLRLSIWAIRDMASWLFAVGGLLLIASVGVLFVWGRRIGNPVRSMISVVEAMSRGEFEAQTPAAGSGEVLTLAKAVNAMGDSLRISQQRMRMQHKSMLELSACSDIDALLRKAVEIACTQCSGDIAWFEPVQLGRAVRFADQQVFLGLHGWVWRNHRVTELGRQDGERVWQSSEGDRVFGFTIRNQGVEIGLFKVAYRKAPDENTALLVHSLVSLVELAIQRQENIQKSVLIATELELAGAVQRDLLSEDRSVSRNAQIAYSYQPASRLGGDWFFLIEDGARDRLLIVMGDVAGHGLAQGLLTTAVKGALDVIERLAKTSDRDKSPGPAEIVAYLEAVMQRVAAKSRLTMTCFAAEIDLKAMKLKVCNAGHTFPILIPGDDHGSLARHLHKDQQPMLGGEASGQHTYTECEYELSRGDMLVVYTDGLSSARNLKSRIFGRFLMRNLRKKADYPTAEALRNDIVQMFQYYTQGAQVEDDVCFLVVKIAPQEVDAPSEKSA